MIGIGAMRDRLALQAPQLEADGAGGGTIAWEPVALVWALIETPQGRESYEFGRVNARLTHRVTIRHRDGVTADMRFELGERIFDIRAVLDPDRRRRWLVCLCEEREA